MKSSAVFACLAAIVLLSGLVQYATLTTGHDWGDDFSSYIMQAKSVAEGRVAGFIDENRFTIENSSIHNFGPVAYPWGTSVLLAPLYSRFGLNMLALKSLNVICMLAFIVIVAWYFRGRHPAAWLFLLVAFIAFNPKLLKFDDYILSDIPFLLFSTACVILMQRTVSDRKRVLGELPDALLLGVLPAAAYVIRSNGILLVPTLAASQAFALWTTPDDAGASGARTFARRVSGLATRAGMRSAATGLAPYAVFAVLVVLWDSAFPQGGGGHVGNFGSMSLGTVGRNVYFYGVQLGSLFEGLPAYRALYLLSMPFALAGMIRGRTRDFPMILYIVLTAILYLVWPFTGSIRYFFPVLPFYVHFALTGVRWALERAASRRAARTAAFSVLVVMCLFFVRASASSALANMRDHRVLAEGAYTKPSQEMFDFIRENTQKQDVIVFFKPRLMRMLVDRRSIMVTRVSDLQRGDYLCWRQGEFEEQLPEVEVNRLLSRGLLTPVWANADFRVYRIGPASAEHSRTPPVRGAVSMLAPH